MALRGLKITWVYIAILFISCSIFLKFQLKNIVHFCYFQNHFLFVSMPRQTDDIGKKRPKKFTGQTIASIMYCRPIG